MDLARFDTVKGANDGAEMHVRHPGTNELLFDGNTPITIRLCGEDSDRWRKAVRDAAEKRRRNANAPMTDEAAEEEASEVLAAISLGWCGISDGDQPIEFSHEAAREQYRRHPWLREQASLFKGSRANFVPAP